MKQSEAIKVMASRSNVFLSGPPGSGKSYILNQFVNKMEAEGLNVAVTATTGIAASLIGGVTIHAWASLPRGGSEISAPSDACRTRLKNADVLIIDEISMLGAKDFENLDTILKNTRDSDAPFGALQIIACGDFYQLPPVARDSGGYVFESEAWGRLSPKVCILSGQFRQTNDKLYAALVALRNGEFTSDNFRDLLDRQKEPPKESTYLLTHNLAVDRENTKRLQGLKGGTKAYEMVTTGDSKHIETLTRSLVVPQLLELKQGARVMFTANNISLGYVNGTQGKVVGFKKGLPLIETDQGSRILAEAYQWNYEIDGEKKAEAIQIPLKLAWAVTIHKSQGMSLDSAVIDLSRSFTFGMGYVALSRIRTYEGLYLLGINSRSLELDPKVRSFYKQYQITKSLPNSLQNKDDEDYVLALYKSGASKRFISLSTGLAPNRIDNILKR